MIGQRLRLSRIRIEKFRNFEEFDVRLGEHAVIVGENKVGKSNLLYALRLVLDPSLPDSARELRDEDFWDGLPRPLGRDSRIIISVELTGFEANRNQFALLAENLVNFEPLTARLTYVFQVKPTLEGHPTKKGDFEFFVFGGERADNGVSYDVRRRLPMDVLAALRDAEGDLANWRRSPLRPLLEDAATRLSRETLERIAQETSQASSALAGVAEISQINSSVTDRLGEMVGDSHGVDVRLGLSPTDPDRLVRSLRLLIDQGSRGINEASLGTANLIYLALKSLEFQLLVREDSRDHTFLAIEEPEAHLHPHLQRLVYRDFLRPRVVAEGEQGGTATDATPNTTVLLTTHSPHIVSVAPLRSLVLLRKSTGTGGTVGCSTAALDLDAKTIADLERYLDVTRGEIVFSRGVLLVEGEAESFVIPALARLNGFDLDEIGITVCSVGGTHFTPYVKLLGANGLNIPFAVLTDYDPTEDFESLGVPRAARLLEEALGIEVPSPSDPDVLLLAEQHGIFVNTDTFEIDLMQSGQHDLMCEIMVELTDNGAARDRATACLGRPDALDRDQFLRDIEHIGKGRFAQRVAARLSAAACPDYILNAIRHVVACCT